LTKRKKIETPIEKKIVESPVVKIETPKIEKESTDDFDVFSHQKRTPKVIKEKSNKSQTLFTSDTGTLFEEEKKKRKERKERIII